MEFAMITLEQLNAMDRAAFVAALGDVFEHAAWVAEAAAARRPFATVTVLHEALLDVVRSSPAERQLAFIGGHPELGSKVQRRDITIDSQREQGSLGLDRLSDSEFSEFQALNARYKATHGFPFIICVRRQTRDAILAALERRSGNARAAELAATLDEIGYITRLRLVAKVDGAGLPKTTGRLSTHVLDTASGKPAAGVKIVLSEIGRSARGVLQETVTNSDGRTDAPLIAGEPLRVGIYEIAFHAGEHFRRHGVALPEPSFVDVVPVRFGIAEPEAHYHVPLLVSPWSFSTYRGS